MESRLVCRHDDALVFHVVPVQRCFGRGREDEALGRGQPAAELPWRCCLGSCSTSEGGDRSHGGLRLRTREVTVGVELEADVDLVAVEVGVLPT
jgi:hypothetical protein